MAESFDIDDRIDAARCPACGAAAVREQVVTLTVNHSGQTRLIEGRQTVCGQCGGIGYADSHLADQEIAVAAAMRDMAGLLSAEDLRRIRTKYQFRQTDLEQMLAIGPKTWTRWERGRVPHSKAADTLLRLLADDAELARRLMEQAGIDNPRAAAALADCEAEARRRGRAMMRAALRQHGFADAEALADCAADIAFAAVREARRLAASALPAA